MTMLMTFYELYNGQQFKQNFGTNFYKILNNDLIHHDYQYVDELNHCPSTHYFDIYSEHGLHFTSFDEIFMWINDKSTHIVKINILDDSMICELLHKFKANKFMIDLSAKFPINELECWSNFELCELAVRYNYHALKYVQNQTSEICKIAVKLNGRALEFVHNQTSEICEIAVHQNGWSLKFVHNQTPKICELAVKSNALALQFVHDQTSELCEIAVKSNKKALEYVHNQTLTCKLIK